MENIFENAYFGKAYKTRDGRKAIYLWSNKKDGHSLIVDGEKKPYHYNDAGKFYSLDTEDALDIFSKWQEEISEDELDKLAINSNPFGHCDYPTDEEWGEMMGYREGYKAGYRKKEKEVQDGK